ncbi:MAG: redoxin domain-containing protein [Planctomycetes bacterium]|nr:redoxin domain-containing protein [Planctomycetota bacterium]MBI3836094.1 redoxin domain-containing protein [Planctomycetota bacterium]
MLDEIQALGASLIAITPEVPEKAAETASKNQIAFTLLIDSHNEVARHFGIVFQLPPDLREFYCSLGIDLPSANGNQSYELPLPATYIVAPDGIIHARHVDPDYVKRMEPSDILAALRSLT